MNNSSPSSMPEKSQLAAAISAATSLVSSSEGGVAASPVLPSSAPGREDMVKAFGFPAIRKSLRRYQGCLGGWLAFGSQGKLVFLAAQEVTAAEADQEAHQITISTRQDGVWVVAVPAEHDAKRIALGLILGELDWLPFAAVPLTSESL